MPPGGRALELEDLTKRDNNNPFNLRVGDGYITDPRGNEYYFKDMSPEQRNLFETYFNQVRSR